MQKINGSDVVSLRKVFKEAGHSTEQVFLNKLSPDMLDFYKTTLHTSWNPIQKQTELYRYAADALFPEKREKMFLLGKAMATNTFSGVYKIFLRIPSVQFIISRAVSIWKSYHDTGVACIENVTDNSCDFVVREYPSFPQELQLMTKGHITTLLEMAGRSDIKVVLDTSDSNAWRWKISWE